jgi:hypothetical protein
MTLARVRIYGKRIQNACHTATELQLLIRSNPVPYLVVVDRLVWAGIRQDSQGIVGEDFSEPSDRLSGSPTKVSAWPFKLKSGEAGHQIAPEKYLPRSTISFRSNMAIKVVKQDWEKSSDFIAAPDIQASRISFERNALLKMDLLLVKSWLTRVSSQMEYRTRRDNLTDILFSWAQTRTHLGPVLLSELLGSIKPWYVQLDILRFSQSLSDTR